MTTKRIPLDDHTSDTLDALYDELDRVRLQAVNLERDLRTERWYAEDRKRGLRLQRQRTEEAEARQRELQAATEEHRQAHETETENTAREIDRALAAEARVRELEAATIPAGVIAYPLPGRPNALVHATHVMTWVHHAGLAATDRPGGGICAWPGCQQDILTAPGATAP